jgi:hypothetical protein
MKAQLGPNPRNEDMLRVFGYGTPHLGRASESAANAAVLIAQDNLKPFQDDKLFEMRWYPLPWPLEALRQLGAAEVKLRITLSYFIEPNPARRGYKSKYAYASHGLRFDVKRPEESQQQFLGRLNKLAQTDETVVDPPGDERWTLKRNLRSKGSLHCDWLSETGARMAERGQIAIFPTSGWWKERPKLGRHTQSIRYSLVVSLETEAQGVDLYAAIANKINIRVPVPIQRRPT